MKVRCALGFFVVCFLLLAGCDAASSLAGDWGEHSKSRGDVSAAKVGMNSSDVLLKLGKANKIEEGELVYEGWQEWKYPTGSLWMYRGIVKQISVRPLTEEQLVKIKDKGKKYDLNLNVLEGDKDEGASSKESPKARKENDIWSVDEYTQKSSAPTASPSNGFMDTPTPK